MESFANHFPDSPAHAQLAKWNVFALGEDRSDNPVNRLRDSLKPQILYADSRFFFPSDFSEGGIVFHSVIIGVTVGATGGNEFIPLLVAICFHQLCEGLSLATRIGLLATSIRTHYFLFLAFSVSTPLGVTIGTAVRSSYNGSDRTTLLALGVLNSISAGILIYSALVQLMGGDFLYNVPMLNASLKRCLVALLSFILGAAAMVSETPFSHDRFAVWYTDDKLTDRQEFSSSPFPFAS